MDAPCEMIESSSFLEREHRVAASLRETLAMLNSNRSLDEILHFIVHQARAILSAQAAAIYCPTGQSWLMQIQAQEGLSEEYAREARIPLGALATGAAALRREPVSIPNVKEAIRQAVLPGEEEGSLAADLEENNILSLLAARKALVELELDLVEARAAIDHALVNLDQAVGAPVRRAPIPSQP